MQRFFQIVSRLADNLIRTEQRAGIGNSAVILSQMDAVGIKLFGKPQVIVDNERRTKAGTEPFQLASFRQTLTVLLPLGTVLQGGYPAPQGLSDPAQEVVTLIGNQIDPRNVGRL